MHDILVLLLLCHHSITPSPPLIIIPHQIKCNHFSYSKSNTAFSSLHASIYSNYSNHVADVCCSQPNLHILLLLLLSLLFFILLHNHSKICINIIFLSHYYISFPHFFSLPYYKNSPRK